MILRRITHIIFIFISALAFTNCGNSTGKIEKIPILLADREAPLGWISLRIYEDSTFEFISSGLRDKTIYPGIVRQHNDTLFFDYTDSVPKAGKTAIMTNGYVVYIDGLYPERPEIKLNKLVYTSILENDNYKYEPNISTLTGTLTSEIFWGPPNYGEDTTSDKKEREYILTLEKPINMIASDTVEGFDETKTDIKKLQLVSNGKCEQYLNKKVKVSGTIFRAETGHHHAEVLLSVTKIESK